MYSPSKRLDSNPGLLRPKEEAKIEAALTRSNCPIGGFSVAQWLNRPSAAKFIPKGK